MLLDFGTDFVEHSVVLGGDLPDLSVRLDPHLIVEVA